LVGDIRRDGGQPIGPADSIRVAFGVYTACRGGDGYKVPEAEAACARQESAPRAVDLLMQYIADSLAGRIEAPRNARVIQAGNTNPG
jgi:hypothetical protein